MHRAGAQAARISCLDQPRVCLPYWLQTPANCVHGCRCNPSGAVLTPVADNVWGAERPFTWNRIDVGGRGAVIKLSDGTIWTQASKCGGAARCLQLRGCCTRLSSVYELPCAIGSRRKAANDASHVVQSPVELTPELRDAINALGALRHIVSPNFEHVKFARQVRHQCENTVQIDAAACVGTLLRP